MSFSTLSEVEACPRRWALSRADYPHVWSGKGYPQKPQLAGLQGTVVHLSLQCIASALVARGCPSLLDAAAISTLKELGGISQVVQNSIVGVLKSYETSPRAYFVLDGLSNQLRNGLPELRSRVQRLLSRIRLEKCIPRTTGSAHNTPHIRRELAVGSYAECELRASGLGWFGIADLLTLSSNSCEIRDFKTGPPKEEHAFQIRTYALLWARDSDRNPSGRLADRLVLSYDNGDSELDSPNAAALDNLENDLRNRTAAAIASVGNSPPEARPSTQNCTYCAVRHMCDDYWQWLSIHNNSISASVSEYGDIQMAILGDHGPSSWDGILETSLLLSAGRRVLLRVAQPRPELHAGQRVRLLNVRLSLPTTEAVDDPEPSAVATMGFSTEAFVLP